MVGVRHGLLTGGERGTGRIPVQIEDDVHPGAAKLLYESGNGTGVVLPAVLRLHAVDSKPAVLVERDTNRLDVP